MRTRVAAFLFGALLIVVVVTKTRSEPAYDGPVALAAPVPTASAIAAPQWRAVVTALDQARAAGFADPAAADPLDWVSADCPCLAVERAALDALVSTQRRLDAAPPRLVTVDVVAAAELAVTLRVSDVLPAYDEVDAGSRTVRAWPERAAASWTATLVRGPQGWRWAAIERVSAADERLGVDQSPSG